ncbi:YcaO-like family protein [Lactobacillus sp. PSON]|uniref:YcaO-like family protein n=1 Tax=Lactobacillus sp. PSON TaxID=3455454 RepID=UPI0040414F22
MREIKFIKKNEKSLLLLLYNRILTISCSNSNLVSDECNEFIESRKDFLELSKTSKDIISYYNLKPLKKTIIKEDVNFVFDGYTPKTLMNHTKRIISCQKSYLINIYGLILYIPKNITVCLHCLLKRAFYSLYDYYNHLEIWNTQPQSIYTWGTEIDKVIKYGKDKQAISIFDKRNGKIFLEKLTPFADCPFISFEPHRTNIFKKYDGVKEKDENLREKVGLLQPISGFDIKKNSFFPHGYVAKSIVGMDPRKFSLTDRLNGGKGLSKSSAMNSALGEGIERYSAQLFNNDKLLLASTKELKDSKHAFLDIGQFIDDNPLYDYSNLKDYKIEWGYVKNIFTDIDVLIPASFIYFPFQSSSAYIMQTVQDTTGLACGQSIQNAILKGMLEVIERDAYTIYFKSQLPANDIDIVSIKNKDLCLLIKELYQQGYKVHLKYLKTDLPTYIIHCVLENIEQTYPIFTHGSAAALNIYEACLSAINECLQLRISQIELRESVDDLNSLLNSDVKPYVTWGLGHKNKIGNLLNSAPKINCNEYPNLHKGSIKKDIDFLTRSLNDLGYQVYVANLTRNDVKVPCVRVIIPGYQPLDDGSRVTKRLSKAINKTHIYFDEEIFS